MCVRASVLCVVFTPPFERHLLANLFNDLGCLNTNIVTAPMEVFLRGTWVTDENW